MTADDHDSIGAGFALGPALLAVYLASAIYHGVCHGWRFAFGGFSMSVPFGSGSLSLAPIFAVFLLYLTIKTPTKLEKIAWLAFAAYFIVSTVMWITRLPLGPLAGAFILAASLLLTTMGLHRAPSKKIAIAALVFVSLSTAVLLSQHHGERLAGRGSVFREARICP
jgi:hypothetical protein